MPGSKETGPPEGEPADHSDDRERRLFLAFCGGQFAFVTGGLFGDTCRFTGTATQIVKFCATNVTATDDFDFVDRRGVVLEDTLDTFARCDFTQGEGRVQAAVFLGD